MPTLDSTASGVILPPISDGAKSPQPSEQWSSSPPRPPYSPITPVQTFATLAAAHGTPPPSSPAATVHSSHLSSQGSAQLRGRHPQASQTLMDEDSPPVLPFSETDNTDAIALRAVLSVLQLQRQQTVHDIRLLERTKEAAMADPEVFVDELKAGKLAPNASDGLPSFPDDDDGDDEDEDDNVDVEPDAGSNRRKMLKEQPRFVRLPQPQNVVRTPPVNWAKYHVVGEALDRLHEGERRLPTLGEVRKGGHVIAAPYSPFVDVLEAKDRGRGPGRKG